jgi:hypothetical protein
LPAAAAPQCGEKVGGERLVRHRARVRRVTQATGSVALADGLPRRVDRIVGDALIRPRLSRLWQRRPVVGERGGCDRRRTDDPCCHDPPAPLHETEY